MAFNPTTDFLQAFAQRAKLKTQRNSLAYGFGNNHAESAVQANGKYQMADISLEVVSESRDRGVTGALADYSPLTADTASLDLIEVGPLANQSFRHRIDRRDLDRVERQGITIAALRQDIVDAARLWADTNIWTAVNAAVPAANKTAGTGIDTVKFDVSSGLMTGNNNQKSTYFGSMLAWLENLTIFLADADLDPNTGSGDAVTRIAVTMNAAQFNGLRREIHDNYKASGVLVTEDVDTLTLRGGGRWRGRLWGTIDIYVTSQTVFRPSAPADGNLNVIACIPNYTWDNAIVTYPLAVNNPDADSAKYRLAQELETYFHMRDSGFVWAFTGNSQA